MGAIFGKSKKSVSRVTEQDKAVLQLKQQRDKLKQYQRKITLTLEKEREIARSLLKDGKKDRAKLILKKKRYQEQILSRTDGQLENLEQIVHDLEYAQIELQMIDGLKSGNAALKKIHEVLKIEDIEKILEETQEGVEKQREIDELLSGALTQEDEDAVSEELDQIIRESLPTVPMDDLLEGDLVFPQVPEDKIEKKKVADQPKRVKIAA
uniref:Charged multivesicular body protein 6 n=1 Tax=Strigamia maritima TaxID=126957 RepID=T1J1H5_STRMM